MSLPESHYHLGDLTTKVFWSEEKVNCHSPNADNS